MKPLPRLTRAIRAFTGLSKPDGIQPASAEEIISEYRQKKKLQDKQEKVSYETLKKELAKYLPSKQVSADLQNLRNLVKQLIGEETNLELVDDATVSLFFYFIGKWHVGPSDVSFLKQTYGAIDLLQANAVYRAVQSLLSGIPSEIQSSLKNLTAEDGSQTKFEFGKGLAFNFPNDVTSSDDHELVDWTQIEKNHKTNTPTLSFAYNELPAQEKDKPNEKPKKSAFDRSWLHRELQTYNDKNDSAPVPVEEFVESIVTLVCSQKTDDELQNEFFELLGFDRFELIQQLLEHREDIVKAEKSYTAKALVNSRPAKQVAQGSGPVIAGQVLIQSEQEKFLRKQVRKEEKRMQKARTDEEMEEITSSHAAVEHALSSVSGLPLLRRSAGTTVERYPNVYDSLAEAKHSSAMVGGMKMALPSSMERINNSKYEEISIPATEQSPSEVGKNRIKISSLDEVGQLAFKGCKTLNQIQTVVFEAAYKTNENLLICAPTGAGKTNIAMLTVVHQIKQFIENGVLKKDQFKIVYVAPMKALAAEMTENFGKRLAPLGLVVKELTGDMQLTKTEIMQTQMLVTTPEKWDVITRKSTGDAALSQLVKLLIIDEVHLLHGDRGPVVEALVARTLRLVETSQNMIRIVGLSATLPNYIDVARFLRVNPYVGLFYFDSRFRPVPLSTCFIGVKEVNPLRQMQEMDAVCYDKVVSMVEKGHQVMVFVHARNATVRTAQSLREAALNKQQLSLFRAEENPAFGQAAKVVAKSRNKQMVELFNDGFSIHHAGMLRSDRNLVEKYFSEGLIKVLVCTATLAWGVNLPAHAVIIKGTEIYDAKHGSFVDLGILDVLQIFGRAGRPQFDKSGHGTIITSHDKLSHYLSLLTCQYPIESSFEASMIDNLNAEISLGSVTNVDEAVEWLSYSYLFIRMRKNPVAYGIRFDDLYNDPQLMAKRKNLIETAAQALDKAQMIRFDLRTGLLHPTDLGRTASDFYIKYATVEVFNEKLRDVMNDAEIFALISEAQEFDQIKVRDDELDELDDHKHGDCELPVKGGSENTHGKVNILLQTYISRGRVNSFSLVSDQSYIVQNATRIARALFEIVLRRNWALMAGRVLRVAKMMEQKLWDSQHPLNQFPTMCFDILQKIESKRLNLDKLREMDSKEIGYLINNQRAGPIVKRNAMEFPQLAIDASVQPITRTVLRVRLTITANYRWNDKVHGSSSEPFWVWVENPEDNHMYHYEFFSLTKKQVMKNEEQTVVFTIPIFEPLPSQYYVRVVSDRWLGCDFTHPMSFQHLILPERHPPHTDLLDLQPLPVTALNDSRLELLYPFTHFNPIQTQLFHILYHTDRNVLLGAPTGSGKTIVAEIAMFRVFREYPKSKVVYIAPLKALVRERIDDWKERLERKLNLKVVELTGDVTPDVRAIAQADVIVTTPEKWDGVSRSWQTRDYVRSVALIIIDEIHLLGEDRGPVLEVIVSRTNFIANHTGRTLRLIGLSTAIANARDLADWLNIGSVGLFNFRPSVRPVPLEVHISGFPGKHYCPRMATMNKPTYQAIKQHSPDKPVLVFVSSRRQTRLTALDLIGLLAVEENPRQFVRLAEEEMEQITAGVKDPNLKLTLSFGIGLHHAGLTDKDRRLVEELFVNQKIQVLIATATLAWGVNFPAHLVVIKGTEYYDGKTRRYVDMPITDVLQMMGRAGRPQFDDQGVAVVLVHDIKKHFYKKFLYEPFPVESSLLNVLPDHLNAEIVAGTIGSKQDALDYLTWTYFFRRLLQNPTYYDLDDVDPTNVNRYLSSLIDTALGSLSRASCIDIEEDNRTLQPTTLGRIASYYYLSFNTLQLFRDRLGPDCTLEDLLSILSDCTEYGELPVRHNEDLMNTELAKSCPISVNPYTMDSSHTKAHLLFQAHFSRLHLPVADYYTDTKSVLDQALRILQAMIDVSADSGWLSTTLRIQQLMQMVVQGVWVHDPSIMILPHVDRHLLPSLTSRTAEDVLHLPLFIERFGGRYEDLASRLRDDLDEHQIQQIHTTLQKLPLISVSVSVNSVRGSIPVQMVDSSSYKDIQWVPVAAGMDCVITVTISCDSPQQGTLAQAAGATGGARPKQLRVAENAPPQKGSGKSNYAYAPRFPKPKDEGWFLIAGSVETKELLALKRVSMGRSKSVHQMTIPAPTLSERFIVTLYLVSDCYPGMDQQYNVHLEACNQDSLPVLSADEYE